MRLLLVLILINIVLELFLILLCTSKYGTAIILTLEELFTKEM